MSLIIIATDFSAVSENAAHYACQLAAERNAHVLIMHSFIFPVMLSDIPMPVHMINDAETGLEEQMDKMVSQFRAAYPALQLQGIVNEGGIVKTLEEYGSRKEAPWLVVMGNSIAGEGSPWDSVILSAFRRLRYPVLAVPPGAAWKPVKKICLAFDNKHTGNEMALTQLRDISLAFNADLQVLNTQVDVLNRDNLSETDAGAQIILEPAKPKYHVLYETDIDDAIQDFISQNDADWLALIPRKHSFFEGLFHKSHSKAIAMRAKVPVLALHETKEM